MKILFVTLAFLVLAALVWATEPLTPEDHLAFALIQKAHLWADALDPRLVSDSGFYCATNVTVLDYSMRDRDVWACLFLWADESVYPFQLGLVNTLFYLACDQAGHCYYAYLDRSLAPQPGRLTAWKYVAKPSACQKLQGWGLSPVPLPC